MYNINWDYVQYDGDEDETTDLIVLGLPYETTQEEIR